MFPRSCIPYLLSVLLIISRASAELINTDQHGVLLNGYDLVSYFQQSKPSKGNPVWQTEYRQARLYFANEANLNAFKADPEAYWPQFSGYCANGLSDGHLVQANPEIYRIIEGRLYLFYSWWGRAQWAFDQTQQIEQATHYWQVFSE